MVVLDWIDTTVIALQNLWQGFISFIPNLVGAIIVFLIGWIISVAIGKLVAEILRRVKFNRIFETGEWKEALKRAEIKVNASAFVGAIIKWVLIIVFLSAAVEILGFREFTAFLTSDVLPFLPNVIVAAFIFVVAVIIADILEKVVRTAVEGAKVGYGPIVGAIVKWSIWIFAIFAILFQLGIAPDLVKIIIQGIVAVFVIAAGIAFGLGGKEIAGEMMQDIRNKLRE